MPELSPQRRDLHDPLSTVTTPSISPPESQPADETQEATFHLKRKREQAFPDDSDEEADKGTDEEADKGADEEEAVWPILPGWTAWVRCMPCGSKMDYNNPLPICGCAYCDGAEWAIREREREIELQRLYHVRQNWGKGWVESCVPCRLSM